MKVWIGFGAGLVATPVMVLLFARLMTSLYDGVTMTPEYAIAIAATQDIADAIDRYRNHHQRVPDPLEGLEALKPTFLEQLPLDPWNNPYVYEASDTDFADVLSYGADGAPGGIGIASDISGRYGQQFAPRPASFLRSLAVTALALIPLGALLGARRWPWAAGLLAGTGTLWAMLLFTTLTMTLRVSPATLLGLAIALGCLAGSLAILRNVRGAPTVTCTSVLLAYVLLEYLFTLQ